ncbi:restriction endonuclease subunit S [Mycolicibacterium sarraceniae]|uniref:Type I restriction-modification protein subunit S n=1 Tax=Mycolicibacterium sarraceniae TaxID=1534348 RepID=A0A7I7SNQ1_9MYCO|nr:restriction endonuclease subunit S [Mycolicibacterium sarraceniae]BBY58373.1 type I restriction-modification protein subunit S [Mycolicibacterium sarraceniae]
MSEIAPWTHTQRLGWERRRVRTLGSTASGSGFPPALQGRNNLEIPFYKVKHLGQASATGCLAEADDSIEIETATTLGATVFPAGTLVYAKVGAALMLGRVRTLPRPACIDNNMAGLIPDPDAGVDERFLFWALSQIKFDYLVNPGAVPSLSDRNLLDYPLLVPPLSEQRFIADYLDRETARIDTLIEEQRRLIDMLQERRRSVISGALAPREGWRTGRIKHLGSTCLGKMLDAGRADRDGDRLRPYVRAADVLANGTVNLADLNEMPFSDAEMRHFDLRAEDILLIEGGATVGRPGFLYDDADGIAFQKTVNRLRASTSMSARFCYWVLLRLYESGYYLSHFSAVSFVHLTGEKLREIKFAFPELAEQRTIAAYIDEETSKVDALIAETVRFIDLARERRAALITAAVTGQIEVRNEVA